MAGSSITAADGALFPTAVFLDFILPTYFGWKGLWETRYGSARNGIKGRMIHDDWNY